jgi:dienelactone hydrolase
VRAFAGELRAGGHTVHTLDLFDGERSATIDDGVALTQAIGDEMLRERADRAVAGLPQGLVYAGFSFGAGTAQRLAQTYPGDRHLLTDSSLPSYDPDTAALVVQRSREFLRRVG